MLNPVNKAICRTFLCALAFTSFAGAQIVERSRTLADLLQSHPCNSGLAGRHTIVTDCDAADDLGNGGGAFSCFARCDGVDTWAAVSIGGGAGGGLSDDDYGDVAVSGSGTAMTVEALRGGAVTVAATTGNLQWEGTTADASEGNFTFADPTADWTTAWGATGSLTIPGQLLLPQGSCSAPNLSFSGNADTGWYNASDAVFGYCHEGALVVFIDSAKFSLFDANYQFAIGNSGAVGFARLGTNVARISNGSSGNGWLQQTAGRAALSADYTNATATMSNVSALGVTLLAGQKYTFRMALRFSDSTAADGAVFDFDGGTATATDFGVNCQVWDTALLLSADSTALSTDFSITTATGASKIVCDGSFTVNAAGTFIPRAAQEAHSAGTLTVETGSYLWVEDTPFI